jgi:glutathione synthase
MNILFLMDPLEAVVAHKDTTLALMVGAHRRGHRTSYLPSGGITLDRGTLSFSVTHVTPSFTSDCPFEILEQEQVADDDVDVIFIRTDPPFDANYLMNTWLLDLLPARVVVINRPSGIRTVNEKIWATRFRDLLPATCVTRQISTMRAFIAEELDVIAKPTNGYGGQSVFHIGAGDQNANVILETLSDNGSREIILQRYVPAAEQGDKRILLLNGEVLGAVLRVHGAHDHRNNFFAGGKPEAVDITTRDRKIVAAVAGPLVETGIYFAGIDVIGEHLIEINVTSPTCLQEMNRLYDESLEDRVIEFAESLV